MYPGTESDHCPLRLLLRFRDNIFLNPDPDLLVEYQPGTRRLKYPTQLHANLAHYLVRDDLWSQHQQLMQDGFDANEPFEGMVHLLKPLLSNDRLLKTTINSSSGWLKQ